MAIPLELIKKAYKRFLGVTYSQITPNQEKGLKGFISL